MLQAGNRHLPFVLFQYLVPANSATLLNLILKLNLDDLGFMKTSYRLSIKLIINTFSIINGMKYATNTIEFKKLMCRPQGQVN
ncbi:hypothetical protein GCM10011425_21890 [Mucilaginibacter galii]|uniref:Uncharacterized protein n=1 Tax=Mucilaginibacter galii TaxID=2005073 RepID=A0A917N3C8_9SPHI|nr:hypothetical protein GCM10011425_21890 [Mucilaginibacter galii]